MKKYLSNEQNIFKLLLFLLALSLVPLIIIGFYNHPCADDFSYGIRTFEIWNNTHSFLETLRIGIIRTKEVYNTWQGSFTGVFLMTLHPAIFSENLYALTTTVLLILFSVAIFYFCKVIFSDINGASKYKSGIVSIIIIFLSMQFVISPVESFFWYNGSMYYTLFYSFMLIFIGLTLSLLKDVTIGKKIVKCVVASALGFFIGGGNFVVALVSFVVIALTLVGTFIKSRKNTIYLLIITACSGTALILSVVAPGNAVRQEVMMGMSPFLAILNSFRYSLLFLLNFIRVPVFLLFWQQFLSSTI